jgi:hypothetical protein
MKVQRLFSDPKKLSLPDKLDLWYYKNLTTKKEKNDHLDATSSDLKRVKEARDRYVKSAFDANIKATLPSFALLGASGLKTEGPAGLLPAAVGLGTLGVVRSSKSLRDKTGVARKVDKHIKELELRGRDENPKSKKEHDKAKYALGQMSKQEFIDKWGK